MIPTARIYVVENRSENYYRKFKFASQARAAMQKHGVDRCKVLYLVNGRWGVVGEMKQDGRWSRAR